MPALRQQPYVSSAVLWIRNDFSSGTGSYFSVLRIHDIFGWIRIRGSMPHTNGSGSWIRILLFSSLTFKMPAKNKFAYFLKQHLHHFSKIKSQKESQNSRNQGFSYYFYMMIEGSGSRAGSGSIPLTSGSGSERPKNMWIWWIRIRNTATFHVISYPDPTLLTRPTKIIRSLQSL
jgi:hypothetical protein